MQFSDFFRDYQADVIFLQDPSTKSLTEAEVQSVVVPQVADKIFEVIGKTQVAKAEATKEGK